MRGKEYTYYDYEFLDGLVGWYECSMEWIWKSMAPVSLLMSCFFLSRKSPKTLRTTIRRGYECKQAIHFSG